MKWAEGRAPQEQSQKLSAKKKDNRRGKNISRICSETLSNLLMNLSKIINSELDIKLGQFKVEELDAILKKKKKKKKKNHGFFYILSNKFLEQFASSDQKQR